MRLSQSSVRHICGFGVICGWLLVVRLLKGERYVLRCVGRIFNLVLLRLMAVLMWFFRLPKQVFCRGNGKLDVYFGVYFSGFDNI